MSYIDPQIEPWHLPHMDRKLTETDIDMHNADRYPVLVTRNGMRVVDTCRTYARTMREAFPHDYASNALGIAGPVVTPTRAPWWVRVLRAVGVMA